jgi:hypothetical protein
VLQPPHAGVFAMGELEYELLEALGRHDAHLLSQQRVSLSSPSSMQLAYIRTRRAYPPGNGGA